MHTGSRRKFHTFLLCHWSRGSGANRETGQLMSHLYQHCFLHDTDGFVKYSLSKVWPRSILAFHPCCQGMSFLSQLQLCDLSQSIPMKKKMKSRRRKTEKNIYGFYDHSLITTAEYIYTQLEGESERWSERRQAVKKRGKNGGSLIHYPLSTCISEYYSYQATNTTVG